MPRSGKTLWCDPTDSKFRTMLSNAQNAPDLRRAVRQTALVVAIVGLGLSAYCFFMLKGEHGAVVATAWGLAGAGVFAALGASLWFTAGKLGKRDEEGASLGYKPGAVADTANAPYKILAATVDTRVELTSHLDWLIRKRGIVVAPYLRHYFSGCQELAGQLPDNELASAIQKCAHLAASRILAAHDQLRTFQARLQDLVHSHQ